MPANKSIPVGLNAVDILIVSMRPGGMSLSLTGMVPDPKRPAQDKTAGRNVFEEAAVRNISRSDTPEYLRELRKWQIWSEGIFSIQKWNYNLIRVLRRGRVVVKRFCNTFD